MATPPTTLANARSRLAAPVLAAGLGVGLALVAGCGPTEPTPDVAAAPSAASAPFEFAGMYEVTGTTRVAGSDIERPISGKIVMTPAGNGFASTFSLSTRIATEGGVVAADLNGKGEGEADGTGLAGSAETQMILGAAPGLDPKFGFLPGRFGPRIRSTWRAQPDGSDRLQIEIATVAAPGEDYQSTTTTMVAERTSGPSALKKGAAAVP